MNRALLAFIIVAIVVIAIVAFIIANNNRRQKQANILWDLYQQALRCGDKNHALQAGRRYYSHLRGGRLTIYDEQRLTNDLSTMK